MVPTGEAASDFFGYSVSRAGDVNGDGYDDVIVGAYSNGTGGLFAGRAYVYYGGPGADAVADLTLTAAAAGDQFGQSVSGAGDVNGDGYADVIVGAPNNDAGGANAGRAYVYYGGPSADAVADLTLTGAAASDFFGLSASGAGDVNRDGFDDVIVGANANDQGGVDAGRAYVYYGGPGADAVADLTLTGAAAGDRFGNAVSGAGDVNGDGYADVIVGANNNDAAGTNAGRAYVYYGGPGPDAVADLTLTGVSSSDFFGISVSGAGDVNGDSYADVIVGASTNDQGGVDAGRAYVYYGGPGADAVPDLTLTGAAAGDLLGQSVSGAGDANGDGYADLVVGAPQNDAGGVDAGRTYVYYGGPGVDAVPDLTLTGAAAGDNFGWSVSGGDVNRDGHADVIVGAWGNDARGNAAGRAYVFTPRPYEVLSPNGGEQWIAGLEQRVRWLGAGLADLWISFDGGASYSILTSGVGGRDQNEFALTAPTLATSGAVLRVSPSGVPVTHSNSDASDGVFRIVAKHDPPPAAHRVEITPTGAAVGDAFGQSVSGAGDVNGDGYADVIVGAAQSDAGGADAGRAYVYYGGPDADAAPDLTLTGAAGGDAFGNSVSGAGDVNGDGYGDVIVGAYQNDAGGADAGRAYVYFGGPGADVVADLTLTGAAAGDAFGVSVSGAGDLNGDGYADVIVGAYANDAGGADAGRAYVYYGGPGADAVADLTLTGAAANDFFGYSVSGAGDVNGDGYADVIVGAYANDAGGANAGRAYVYYGGPVANAATDLTLTGAEVNDFFGWSVSGAGDVNGDGNADVIVGATMSDAGGTDAGRAYVYYGGAVADAVADVTLTGAASGDLFGVSVSGARDVNGDGYGDVIVGASANDAGGPNAGRAYVYYGGPGADVLADFTLTGAVAGDLSGTSVSAAGDVNGDGYPDVIVGANANDAGGLDAGRAYLYDCNRYFLTAPNGGESWNVGATKTISWVGAEPADVWLSVDGGNTNQLVVSGVGGSETNAIPIRVPHTPTKFARIKVTPSNAAIGGFDQGDSLFTIQTSVQLLAMLAAALPEGGQGAVISWTTDPGPEDLAGYRLEKAEGSTSDSNPWRTVVALTRDIQYTDRSGGPGTRYRLFAVNGFGEELLLGEASLRPLKPLTAWPLPYRSGTLNISFATSGLGAGAARTELLLFDVMGRLVRRLDSGVYGAGYRTVTWDGRDGDGRPVAAGLYFLRTKSDLGYERSIKVAVLP
ncbi:MAG TPA: FlgD immunoglobulin-like domain containing protein [Candidatus Binatia bacterium]|nr:FlgD immunoglobulin-like domain containing protein [Candidatus Binatia bacterium]